MAITHREDETTNIVPADWVPGPPQGSWTYEAYAALPDDGKRYEIVQGVLVMTPAPEREHQTISKKISFWLFEQIDIKGRGEMFYAPFDVDLGEKNLFQPDLLVVLNEHLYRVQEKRIVGAPDMVVEIISPGSVTQDQVTKRNIYERAGVSEYWLVDPREKTIEVFALENGSYVSLGIFAGEQRIPSRVLPNMEVPVARFMSKSLG